MRFVPGPQLPRHNKRLLECTIARVFLTQLCQSDRSTFSDVVTSPSDPPDVMFTYNEQPRAMELSELVPENRYEKDAIIRKLRRDIIAELKLGNNTAGFVVTIFLADAYSSKIRPGKIQASLAQALNGFFQQCDPDVQQLDYPRVQNIAVPDLVRDVVTGISVFRADLAGDPRLNDDREPLINFGAQTTMLVPEDDCPAIVASRLSEKELYDLGQATWLILWSNHYALASLRNELDNAIGSFLRDRPMKYERIFHLHLFPYSGATEFPQRLG